MVKDLGWDTLATHRLLQDVTSATIQVLLLCLLSPCVELPAGLCCECSHCECILGCCTPHPTCLLNSCIFVFIQHTIFLWSPSTVDDLPTCCHSLWLLAGSFDDLKIWRSVFELHHTVCTVGQLKLQWLLKINFVNTGPDKLKMISFNATSYVECNCTTYATKPEILETLNWGLRSILHPMNALVLKKITETERGQKGTETYVSYDCDHHLNIRWKTIVRQMLPCLRTNYVINNFSCSAQKYSLILRRTSTGIGEEQYECCLSGNQALRYFGIFL